MQSFSGLVQRQVFGTDVFDIGVNKGAIVEIVELNYPI